MSGGGVFGALKNLADEVKAVGEVQQFTRRDIAKIAKCLDEALDLLRAMASKPSPKPGSVTGNGRRQRRKKTT